MLHPSQNILSILFDIIDIDILHKVDEILQSLTSRDNQYET